MKYCPKCRQFLPVSNFAPSPRKEGELKYYCEDCCEKIKGNDPSSIRKQFNKLFGGERVAILNHIKPGEYKYQYWLDGKVWETNDLNEFKDILAKNSLLRIKFGSG